MTTYTINSDKSLLSVTDTLRAEYAKHKYLKVSVRTGKDRSADQNATAHCWYAQIAKALPEDDALGWKCYCKLHHGVPLLRAENEKFRDFYDSSVKKLTYEQKLEAMKFVPVTSIMDIPQFTKYLATMQDDFLPKGVKLEFKEE